MRSIGTLMAGAVVANALLFPAITLYLGNIDRFTLPLLPAMRLVIAASVVLLLSAYVVLGRLSKQRQKSAGVALAIFSLLIWVQGNFLIWDYGSLDGRGIEWRDFQGESLIDIAVWLVLALILIRLSHKRARLVLEIASFIFILQLTAAVYGLVTTGPRLLVDDRDRPPDSMHALTGFNAGGNVLHIVADGFQSDVFEDLIQRQELKETYDRAFDGFVYYREALGIFPYTRFSVPGFLGGKVYSNQEEKDRFIDTVLGGKTIVSVGRDNGFETDIVVPGSYWLNRYARLPHTNLHALRNTPGLFNPYADAATLFDLALFRVTPGAFKVLVYRNQKWLATEAFSTGEAFQFRYFRHTYFLDLMTEQMHLNREKPVYKYLHILNTHNPIVVNEDCEYKGEPSPAYSRYSLTLQSRCTMDTLARLLDKMKALGIYDKAAIVIHADHGGWIGTRRRGPVFYLDDGTEAPPWVKSLASPLIAMKPPGATGPIRISDVPASLLDLPDTILGIMGWPGSFGHSSLMRLREDDQRTRYFRFYPWQDNAWEASYASPILEYAISGSHYEGEWIQNNRFPEPPLSTR